MNARILCCTFMVVTGLFFSPVLFAEEPKTFDECFEAALKRSDSLAAQNELIVQAEERYRQAVGTILPTVDGELSLFRQEKVSSSSATSGAPSSSTSSTSTGRGSLYTARLTASQPIFRGFREIAGMRATKTLKNAQSADYQNAVYQLYKDVTDNFTSILSLEHEIDDIDEELSQYDARIKELGNRVKIGRSRSSEVLTIQSARANLLAVQENLRGQLLAARAVFAFFTEFSPTTPIYDPQVTNLPVDAVTSYLQQVEARPDVRGDRLRIKAADDLVTYERGGHFPSIDVTGNYYPVRSDTLSDPERYPSWDFQLGMKIPIFQGGIVQSKVREKKSARQQATFELDNAIRYAEREIHFYYEKVIANRAQMEALEEAVRTARKNYEVQTRDYRNGLVNNLDVLQALTAQQESERALSRFLYVAKNDWMKLQVASAREPALPASK